MSVKLKDCLELWALILLLAAYSTLALAQSAVATSSNGWSLLTQLGIAFLAVLPATIIAITGLIVVIRKVNEIHKTTNSMSTALAAASEAKGHAKGVADEKASEAIHAKGVAEGTTKRKR